MKKLHARRIGPYRFWRRFGSNTYELEIPRELGINPVFNIENLTLYRTPVDYPVVIFDPPSSTFTSTQPFTVHSPLPSRRHHTEKIEENLKDEIVSTADGGYQRYLVHWRGRPESDRAGHAAQLGFA